MAERNSAYDYKTGTYNRAESVEAPLHEREHLEEPEYNPQISMRRTEARSGSVLTIILVAVLAVALLGAVIYTFNRRNTIYNQVAAANSELTKAEAENIRLQSELESRMTAKNVEDYAENVLGMQKMDSSQVEYIKIQTDDVVNIPEPEEGILGKISDFFDKCVEYFRG